MNKLFYLFCCGFFMSCLNINDATFVPNSLSKLVVSNNFDWKTSKDVIVNIHQAVEGMVVISSENDSLLFYKGYIDGSQSDLTIPVNLPSYITRLNVNSQTVSINGLSADYFTPQVAAEAHSMKVTASDVIQNYSLKLNGTTDWVNFPNTSNVLFHNVFTLEAWVKQEHQQTAKIVQKGDWDGFSLGVDLYHGWMTSVCNTAMAATSVTWGMGQPKLNKWYHLAATFDGKILKLFVDGVMVNSASVSDDLHVNGRNINIGSDNGNQKFFKGNLDNVAVWTIALSDADIVKTIENGITGFENGLLACWKFNEGSGTIIHNSAPAIYNGTLIGSFAQDLNYGSDSDGDGVLDNYDDFPYDPARAFLNKYPSGNYGSLAFEDLWPACGDFDFNDLVVDYQFRNISNIKNKLVETYATFVLRASGASRRNGFGFQFSGSIPSSGMTVTGSKLKGNYITIASNGLEMNQNKPTCIVFDDALSLLKYPGSGIGVNTTKGVKFVTPDTIVLHITYTNDTYNLTDLNISTFNPFMIINQNRGKEVHLVDYTPTALAELEYLGSYNDSSDPSKARFYRTKNNLPFAINIYQKFECPYEKIDILKAYLKIGDWA